MTSRATEIQTLIADIDNLLASQSKFLPRILSTQGQEPRQVLERIRNFLVNLSQSEERDNQSKSSPLLAKFADSVDKGSVSLPSSTEENSHISPQYDFSALMQPLQAELQGLLQERANLVQEIKQLEQRRLHNNSLAQQVENQEQMISEFLQVLTNRLAFSLTPSYEDSTNYAQSQQFLTMDATSSSLTDETFNTQAGLHSSSQVEHLTNLASNLDQRLDALDGTVNVVFEALQQNIQTYHESLSQALGKMGSKGVQGEQLENLINNLASLLQQQTAEVPQTADIKNQAPESHKESTGTINLQELDFEAIEDTATVPDLDAVLLELGQDVQDLSGIETTVIPVELQQARSQVVADEVDQLYASLFGLDDINNTRLNIPLPKNEPSVIPIPAPSQKPEIADEVEDTSELTPPTPPTPDLWVNQQNDILLGSSPESPVETTEELSDIWNILPHEESQNNYEAPASADTIHNLTELLTDFVHVEELPVNNAIIPTSANFEPVISEGNLEQSSDNYTPASSRENLFFNKKSPTDGVPDISLDEAQLRQLEQDLAYFDGELNSSTTNVENQENTDNTHTLNTDSLESQVTPNTFDSFTEESLIVESEKPEVTNLNQDNSFLSVATPINDSESKDALESAVWYLGIDLGTTGISAALLNRSNTEVYPLYWSAEDETDTTSSLARSFRLPAEVYLPAASVPPSVIPAEATHNLFSAQLKPYLHIAIPYKSDRQKWEPVLQLNEFSMVPLIWIVRSLSKLLLTLKSDRTSTTPGLTAAAVGIDGATFRNIISKVAGIICTCPSNWSEQYRFNVREALITSKLVPHPQQVFFVEEAIASLLSELDGANGEIVKLSTKTGSRLAKVSEHPVVGNTLVINIGASSTEMALVDLPENLQELAHSDFMLHSFAFAGKGIEQDIICQLLFPAKWRESRNLLQEENKTISSNPWHWQPAIPGLDQMRFSSLGLETLDLPRPGEPDLIERTRLIQRLESSLLGQAVLDAAIALRLILQHQESFTLDLADQRWTLQRRDLESQVFVPFVRRLNRELNRLLVARGIPTEAINQAILTGGVASIGAVSRWLRQKLPNAKIIQDLYLGENGIPTCSRVAYGLAMLPLHPQVLEVPRQQYTDYFLFTELLRLLPERSVSFGEVIQLFEGRGINTRSCQQRLLAFLEGELPPGLIPNTIDFTWLGQSSQQNADYKAIASAPLFEKQGSLTYRPNLQQLQALRRYLTAIKGSTQQSLLEPYTVNFAVLSC
ncbi:MAG: hypothetical protein KME60_09635 [Cyanomargarita calcarea GSE-NOS-MK-12-04C]|uniref:Uncharacterized protein n=1 Tax=Cyanomargarita calcarea GSE-NOS-MK-12-04C TaxID=2839659 RepID=A0A951US87_9CYAN|nr:hypothetical protein [Cyanomargarita calcarea GSE-NOS-MK-12-04C]